MTTVLIADDHPAYRLGLAQMLDDLDDVELVGQAAHGEDAVRLGAELAPDVVVMDLRMPGVDGIEATRRLREASPRTAVIVLTMFEDDNSVFAAMRAGALGYLLKGAEQDEIVGAICAVARGEAIFGPEIARRVIAHFAGMTGTADVPFPTLTAREREILQLVGSGLGNAAIAQRLSLTLKTVRNHVSNIFVKLQVSDRAQAIVRARQAGMAGPGQS
jgi:DNA-binding NarL/FixJ family response regulator